MSKIRVKNTFHCPKCELIYCEGDEITVRKIGNHIMHDCDNCLCAIELEMKDNLVDIK